MTINFSKPITFPDNTILDIHFSAEIIESGFNYCYGSEKGFKRELELNLVEYDGFGLTDEQIEHLESILDSQEIEDAVWATYEREVNA